ncbi:hypothetical protein TWF751_004204 [Orbilia oligospora]|nr:hypothetical protein TWF751_004204 [Orbilia oligospora]
MALHNSAFFTGFNVPRRSSEPRLEPLTKSFDSVAHVRLSMHLSPFNHKVLIFVVVETGAIIIPTRFHTCLVIKRKESG